MAPRLDIAIASAEQSLADVQAAIDEALRADKVATRLMVGMIFQSAQYIRAFGLTDLGRKKLATILELCRNELELD